MALSEETKNRFKRFRKTKWAWYSLIALVLCYGASLTSPWLVNDEPLILKWEGSYYFPAFAHYSDTGVCLSRVFGRVNTELNLFTLPTVAL